MSEINNGIFLHKLSWSDSSLIVTFFTKEYGLKKYIYRGGKKKAHALYPLAINELTSYGRPESELTNLTKAEIALPSTYQFNPIKSTVAFFVAELMLKCLHSNESDARMYPFLIKQIVQLNNDQDISDFPIKFLIRFTELLGIKPAVEGKNPNIFNLDEGIIGEYKQPGVRTEQGEVIEFLVTFLRTNEFGSLNKETREKLLDILLNYYKIHIPKFDQLDTYSIVKEVLND